MSTKAARYAQLTSQKLHTAHQLVRFYYGAQIKQHYGSITHPHDIILVLNLSDPLASKVHQWTLSHRTTSVYYTNCTTIPVSITIIPHSLTAGLRKIAYKSERPTVPPDPGSHRLMIISALTAIEYDIDNSTPVFNIDHHYARLDAAV